MTHATPASAMAGNPTCYVLTPSGRGAIAVVRVSGPGAVEIVDQFFLPAGGHSLVEQPVGRICFGRWGTADGEEVIAYRWTTKVSQKPAEDLSEVEIHCHGGIAAVQAICSALTSAGCLYLPAVEWASQLHDDPLRTAACRALANATTERAAMILLDQWNGALRREVTEICRYLQQNELTTAQTALQRLVDRWQVGRWLERPARIVLAGAPNVGKSSLINRLLGYERTIVFDQPGTTRDVVSARSAIDGWPVTLHDTAGLRTTSDELERAGIERAGTALAGADLVLLVAEAPAVRESPAMLVELAERFARQVSSPQIDNVPWLLVVNKIDQLSLAEREMLIDRTPSPVWLTSALADQGNVPGAGIDQLLQAIADQLAPQTTLVAGDPVPFTTEQMKLLQAALASLQGREPQPAEQTLQTLLLAIT